MATLAWAFGATLIASVGSGVIGGAIVSLPAAVRRRAVPWLVAFSAGAMLGAAFVDLLPEALAGSTPQVTGLTMLAGLVGFLLLELSLAHRHGSQRAALGPLLLLGDALHNFVDGVAIAAAFSVSTGTGIGIAIAVLAHEVPQEVGDVAMLLDAGYTPRRAFFANLGSQAFALLGALGGSLLLRTTRTVTPVVLAVAFAGFIYVAVADVIPEIQRAKPGLQLVQSALLIAGAALIVGLHLVMG